LRLKKIRDFRVFVDQPNELVESADHVPPRDQHQENQPRAVQAVRPGRRDAGHGGEDDVRPAAEGDGKTHFGRAEETGRAQKVSFRSLTPPTVN